MGGKTIKKSRSCIVYGGVDNAILKPQFLHSPSNDLEPCRNSVCATMGQPRRALSEKPSQRNPSAPFVVEHVTYSNTLEPIWYPWQNLHR